MHKCMGFSNIRAIITCFLSVQKYYLRKQVIVNLNSKLLIVYWLILALKQKVDINKNIFLTSIHQSKGLIVVPLSQVCSPRDNHEVTSGAIFELSTQDS